MKLYDSFGMNPRIVRFFVLEKGIEVEREEVDIFSMENRREPYISRNPSGQTPLLELDDGTYLAETGAICEYLEEKHPEPPLIGSNEQSRACGGGGSKSTSVCRCSTASTSARGWRSSGSVRTAFRRQPTG